MVPRPRIAPQTMNDVPPLLVRCPCVKCTKCQGYNAGNAAGLPVSPMAPDAVEWCLRGACIKVLEPSLSALTVDMHNPTSHVSKFMADAFGFTDARKMVQWNDTQGRSTISGIDPTCPRPTRFRVTILGDGNVHEHVDGFVLASHLILNSR